MHRWGLGRDRQTFEKPSKAGRLSLAHHLSTLQSLTKLSNDSPAPRLQDALRHQDMEEALKASLCSSVALLAIKMATVKLLCARSRIITQRTIGTKGSTNYLGVVAGILLAAFPGWTTPDVDALERIEKNSVENEPYTVAVIAAAGSIGAISSPAAITALNVFTISRYIHSAIMCYGVAGSFKQTVQTAAFLPSPMIPLIVAGLVLKKIHF